MTAALTLPAIATPVKRTHCGPNEQVFARNENPAGLHQKTSARTNCGKNVRAGDAHPRSTSVASGRDMRAGKHVHKMFAKHT